MTRQFYMDTNVFISSLKSDDPYHIESKAIARRLEGGEIQAETSVLTLVETASVASRLHQTAEHVKVQGKDRRRIFIIKTILKLVDLKIRFINIAGDTPIAVKKIQANLPIIFNDAIIMSLHTPLRTFDLMHLAAARHGKQMNPELGALVTGDAEFLSRKQELAKIIKMPVMSPQEYVETLGK